MTEKEIKTQQALEELQARRGSNLKIWWGGIKWALLSAVAIFTSASAFNWGHEGHPEGWVFGTLNIILALYISVKGFRAYKKEQDAINAEIADLIRGRKKA